MVIPTCNRNDFLRAAVESALAQTIEILEIIVVDDASDSDPNIAVAGLGEKVRVERLTKRSGANVARNLGIELARGDIIALLDDDDVWLPEKTEIQLNAMAQGAEACLCIARDMRGAADKPRHIDSIEERLRIENPCGTSGLVARRTTLLAEPFDRELRRAQDWDVFVRLAQRGRLVLVEQPLYLRRVGHDRITTGVLRQSPEELFDTAAAAHKHRDWLGPRAYRRRLATVLLTYIAQRKGKARYIGASLRHAGLRATLEVLLSKLARRGA